MSEPSPQNSPSPPSEVAWDTSTCTNGNLKPEPAPEFPWPEDVEPFNGSRLKNWNARLVNANLDDEFDREWRKVRSQNRSRKKGSNSYLQHLWKITKMRYAPKVEEYESSNGVLGERDKGNRRLKGRERQLMFLSKDIPTDRMASLEHERAWARNHLMIEPRHIDREKVPSRGAVMILLLAEQNPKFKLDLFTKSTTTSKPEKPSHDSGASVEQDERLIKLSRRLEKTVARDGPTGDQ